MDIKGKKRILFCLICFTLIAYLGTYSPNVTPNQIPTITHASEKEGNNPLLNTETVPSSHIPGFVKILIVLTVISAFSLWNEIKRVQKIEQTKVGLDNLPEFKNQKSIFKYDVAKKLYGLALDQNNNKVAFIEDSKISLVNFNSILSCELVADEQTLTQTNRGSQIAGGVIGDVLLGGVGLLIGGLSGSKRSNKQIKELTLKIVADDLVKSSYKIILFSVKKPKILTKAELQEVDEWHSLLQVIIARNKK